MKRDRSGRITHVAEMDEAVRRHANGLTDLGSVSTLHIDPPTFYGKGVGELLVVHAPRPSRLERWSAAMQGVLCFAVLIGFVVVLWVGLYTVGAKLTELAG